MAFTGSMHSQKGRLVSFPGWKAALAASKLSSSERERFATEVSRFLRYCQILNAPVTVPRSREYLSIVPLVSARPVARLALRWYFATARAARPDRDRSPLLHRRRQATAAKASRREGDVRDAELAPPAERFASLEENVPAPPAATADSYPVTP